MKALIEKLKSLDKRVYIIAGAALVLAVAVIVTVCIVVGNNKNDNVKPDDTTIAEKDTTEADTTEK